jgi:hypothetical protein
MIERTGAINREYAYKPGKVTPVSGPLYDVRVVKLFHTENTNLTRFEHLFRNIGLQAGVRYM